jgi:gamma-glutamylcysteine synthetase
MSIQTQAGEFREPFPPKKETFRLAGITSAEELWPDVKKGIEPSEKKEGNEEEILFVTAKGERFTLDEVYWDFLKEKDVVKEAGGSTGEWVGPPVQTLFESEALFLETMLELAPWAEQRGLYLLKYSQQPVDVASIQEGLDASNHRYQLLNDHFSGALAPFRDFACTQRSICIGRDEVVAALNLSWTTPVFIALGANCSVGGGEVHGMLTKRFEMWDGLDNARPGAQKRTGITPYFSNFSDFIQWVSGLEAIYEVQPSNGEWAATEKTFGELEFSSMQDLRDALALFLTFVWTDIRIKMPKREDDGRYTVLTAEGRMSCQQPLQEMKAFDALAMGLLCNAKKVERLRLELEGQCGGRDTFQRIIEEWKQQACKLGFEVTAWVSPEFTQGVMNQLLELAQDGLNNRGYGEEVYLQSLFRRLEEKTNPALEALKVWQERGPEGLVQVFSLNTPENVVYMQKRLAELRAQS